ncbi:hypothetical protein ACJIZ3_007714 [Penstemon smallii]|uniref:Transmembrane protein n=1 Tax=Penstemon smallii TaxID=265156 RepID=A0ABD3T984_9LAMI
MEDERERDLRVPLISSLLCLLVSAGGIFLVLYVYVPNLSQPWYPIAAFVLIGSPWIFWLFTYLYTCMKGCFRRPEGKINHRQTTMHKDNSVASSKESEFPLAYSV